MVDVLVIVVPIQGASGFEATRYSCCNTTYHRMTIKVKGRFAESPAISLADLVRFPAIVALQRALADLDEIEQGVGSGSPWESTDCSYSRRKRAVI